MSWTHELLLRLISAIKSRLISTETETDFYSFIFFIEDVNSRSFDLTATSQCALFAEKNAYLNSTTQLKRISA